MRKILLFQIYGDQSAYHLELTYSVLSAAQFLRHDPADVRLVLAADTKNFRPDLPVDHLLVTSEMLNEWQMGGSYKHAIQAYALHHALLNFDAPTVLIDTDTFFIKHPKHLFNRIGPGKALMHISEGKLSDSIAWPEWRELIKKTDGVIENYPINLSTVMHNAGVLGLHPHDSSVMNDVKSVMNIIRQKSPMFTAVQLAASLVFETLEMHHCNDVVDHYWGKRRPYFHYQMNRMFPEIAKGGRLINSDRQIIPLQQVLPGKLMYRVFARLKKLQRGASMEYGYAYMAYLSALSLHNSDEELANVWAASSLNMLMWGVPINHSEARIDFRKFSPSHLHVQTWMQPSLRQRWLDYWATESTHNDLSSTQ